MKVYVIEKGRYSDKYVVAVTETKEKAEQIVDAISGRNNSDYVRYTEYDTNQFVTSLFRYDVWDDEEDGWRADYDGYYSGKDKNNEIHSDNWFTVYAFNPDEAIRIAQDMQAKIKAKETEITF